MKLSLLALVLICLYGHARAQSLPTPRNVQKAYQKGTRSTDGMPGKNYWQNTATYQINVEFSPQSRLVQGDAVISYVNNSPDTLKQVWFKLYPNLYKKGAPRAAAIAAEDLTDGVVIDSLWLGEKIVPKKAIRIDATNMIVLGTAISPGSTQAWRAKYHYTLNAGSHTRTGQVDSGAFFIAYFFPRIAVYDDIDGWNKNPYLGSQEFYNDFCDFDVHVKARSDMLAWATGDLQNCNEIFQRAYCDRIARAELSDTAIDIIDSTDLAKQVLLPASSHTWHFKASHVTDFVFALSNHYLWKSVSVEVDPVRKRRTRVDAVFNKAHADYFQVVHDARRTVEVMSTIFPKWPFPYNHETVFDGLDQMEYPMMVNDNPVEDRAESIELTDHEIFHTMFPFYMGINETKYGWMDEGWATIGEWLVSPLIDSSIVDLYGVGPYSSQAGTEIDLPVTTLTTQLNGGAMFLNSYPKPAFGYLFVKDMLGDTLFTKALHHYISAWQGKHPLPNDFFESMNRGAGRNMNWFWKKWFFDDGYPDLGITKVAPGPKGTTVTIAMKGTKPVPVHLRIAFTDGSSTVIHRTIAVWEKGNTTLVLTVPGSRKISKIEMGDAHIPDSYPEDNVWPALKNQNL